MVAIIDYGVGNLFSLVSSFKAIGVDAVITGNAEEIKKADKIILPGVGAFGDAIDKLRKTGLDKVIIDEVKNGKELLGICLGMQLLFQKSYEYGEHEGLGLIDGNIKPIEEVKLTKPESKIFKYLKDGDFVYFVHSFYGADCDSVIATANYGADLTAAVSKGNVYGCQFHPEKSGEVGLKILKAFCEV